MTYDAKKRWSSTSFLTAGGTDSVSASYDANKGVLTQVTLPVGSTYRPTAISLGNGLVESWSYEPALNRLSGVTAGPSGGGVRLRAVRSIVGATADGTVNPF